MDRFRDRLMIPITDIQGRVIGFGGRTLGDEQPKYLNSPDTELFNKGKTLFALNFAKAGITKQDQAVVVEGYFDAIALHAAGINQAVASLGTALTGDQVKSLLRYTESKQIILNFDADKAGVNAASRAISSIFPLVYGGQVGLRVVTLPDGKDADEFLLHNPVAKYQELLTNAPLWIDWQLQQLVVGADLKQADQFQQVNNEMVKILKEITDNNLRTSYLQQCATLLSQGDGKLFPLLLENLITSLGGNWQRGTTPPQTKNTSKNTSQYSQQTQQDSSKTSLVSNSSDRSLLEKSETLLMRLYLHCPEYREVIITVLEERNLVFTIAEYRFLWQQIVAIEPTLSRQQPDLIARIQDEYLQFPEKLNQISHLFHLDEYTENQISVAPELINAAVACMERVICEKCYRYYLDLWQKTDFKIDRPLMEKYWLELNKSKERIKALDRELQFLYFYR
ncbi:MAG: toprim domain-containing protein [Coleofasciculaceae cyanobacterium SM2_1_6]|nr:toprim domain-containing protein [Coleofasciculaceae cyanobacterium SM2_1_6]